MTPAGEVAGASEKLVAAFRLAFLLTGDGGAAEKAVLDGIVGCESVDQMDECFIAETVKSAIRQRAAHKVPLAEAFSQLRPELRRLSALAPTSRDCFILRFLAGMTSQNCSAILSLTTQEFEASLLDALQELPRLKSA